jgi:hypothetical protein
MGEEIKTEDELRRDFGDDWVAFLEIVYFPPVSARRKPAWLLPNSPTQSLIPETVKELMAEIYTALQNGSRRLVAMGTRSVLETIMVDQTGDQRTFKQNMDAFLEKGHLSLKQRHNVEAILEAGHATIHRGWKPTDRDVSVLMDITESVIETTYLHESRARDLETTVPRRPPRRRPEGSGTRRPPEGPA